jgi:hypothetical protein
MLLVLFEGHEEAGGMWLPADSPRLWRGPMPLLQQQDVDKLPPAALGNTCGSICGCWQHLAKVSRQAVQSGSTVRQYSQA